MTEQPRPWDPLEHTNVLELEPYLRAPVETINGPISALELWARFDQSPIGRDMDTQPYRFSEQFGYDRHQMVEDLGYDIVPTDHQFMTGLYTALILEGEMRVRGKLPIHSQDVGMIVLTGLIHDTGESTHSDIEAEVGAVVGDIPFGLKTDADRVVEANVRHAIYKRFYSDLPPETLECIEAIIAHEDTTIFHDMYEAAHTLQTCDTGIKAYTVHNREFWAMFPGKELENFTYKNSTREPDVIGKLGKIHSKVSRNIGPLVVEYARQFAFADEFTKEYSQYLEIAA
ncbi:MAG: hypothetical protein JWL85_148 [Candidatus Saccharibacteria bacterium]|nr:hypothetical protein [Candidatus Saccharibacteria bacterium]